MKITLNLLPEDQKTALTRRRLFFLALQQELYIVLIVLIFFVGLLSIHIILKTEADLLQKQVAGADNALYQEQVQSAYDLFATTNSEMRDLFVINDHHISWTALLRLISAQVDQEIRVDELHIRDAKLQIKAVAKTRDDAVAFRDRLSTMRIGDVSCLENVNVPAKDLAVATDIAFVLTADILQDCAMITTTQEVKQAPTTTQHAIPTPDTPEEQTAPAVPDTPAEPPQNETQQQHDTQ